MCANVDDCIRAKRVLNPAIIADVTVRRREYRIVVKPFSLLVERTRWLKPDKNIAVKDAGDQQILPFHHHVSRKFPPILQQGLPVFRPERIIPCPCIAKGNAIRRAAYRFFG